ncbi:hypothetical protein LWX53_00125 [bacterium]|nr:hypothetical protein [bacterium]
MNTLDFSPAALVAGLLFLFAVGLLAGLALGRRTGRLEAERGLPERLAAERDDAVKRSRSIVGGQVAEQVAPYLPEFPCDPGDARFVGKPVDFVCFSGASAGEIEEIVFVEVKTGASALSKTEKSLRDAIVSGRVRWVEYRIPLD